MQAKTLGHAAFVELAAGTAHLRQKTEAQKEFTKRRIADEEKTAEPPTVTVETGIIPISVSKEAKSSEDAYSPGSLGRRPGSGRLATASSSPKASAASTNGGSGGGASGGQLPGSPLQHSGVKSALSASQKGVVSPMSQSSKVLPAVRTSSPLKYAK